MDDADTERHEHALEIREGGYVVASHVGNGGAAALRMGSGGEILGEGVMVGSEGATTLGRLSLFRR